MTLPPNTERPHLLDRQLLACRQEDSLPLYRWLRDEHPVYWDETTRAWCVSRYEDVRGVSKNPAIFSSAQGSRPNVPPTPSMINCDEPLHGTLRRFVSKGFTPRQLALREQQIRGVATRLIDAVAHEGHCDFVADVATRLPLGMIGAFLGIPERDLDALGHWSDVLTQASDSPDAADTAQVTDAFQRYAEYMRDLCERRRSEPRDDLVSILVHAEVEGEKLEEDQLIHETLLLLVGGSETSRNVMSSAVDLLSRHPAQQKLLVEQPERLPAAVEEFIRWASPVLNMRRTATEDTELRGEKIRAGDPVLLHYPAANFDERMFDEPERFDVERSKNPHVAFGIGVHFCLGANLARLQIRILFEELLRRLPDIRVTDGFAPEYAPSSFVRGMKSLPVEYTPEGRARA